MDPRDWALQQTCPTVVVPKFGTLDPMPEGGHRLLVAVDGLWLEVRRPWLHVRVALARQTIFNVPYGEVSPLTELAFGQVPPLLKQRFLAEAQAALPNEHAAWLVWDERQALLGYQSLQAIKRGPSTIQYHRPHLAESESLAVDIHSHGHLPAFFSRTDNEDDRGAYKLAIVVGSFGSDELSVAMRLCLGGWFIALPTAPITAKEWLCDT